jgi:hypothetical protein
MPPMAKVVVAKEASLAVVVRNDGKFAGRHHAHAAVEAVLSNLARSE